MNRIRRTIQAPGVEVNEIDLSQYSIRYDFSNLTMVMLNGFSDKGENYLTDVVTSVNQFTEKFGKPTNEAERYLYNAVKETIRGGGVGVVTKMPYFNNSFEKYTYTKYKVANDLTPLNQYSLKDNLSDNLEKIVKGKYNGGQKNDVAIRKFHDFIFDLCGFNSQGYEIASKAEGYFGTTGFYENAVDILTGTKDEKSIKELLNQNGIEEEDDLFKAYCNTLGLDDVTDMATFIGIDASLQSELNELYESAKYCELSKLDTSLTSFIEIKSDDEMTDNYMPYNVYDDLLIGNDKFLKKNEIAIVDVSRTRYEKDKRIEDIQHNISGEYIGILPVIVSPANALLIQGSIKQDNTGFLSNYNLIDKIVPIHRYNSGPRTYETSINIMSHGNLLGAFASDAQAKMQVRNPGDGEDEDENDDYDRMVDAINRVNPSFEVFSQPIKSDDPDEHTLGNQAIQHFPAIEFTDAGRLDDTYLKQIGIVVFKMYIDPSDYGRINLLPMESYIGSLDKKAKDPVTGKSIYIENVVNQNSENIRVFARCEFTPNNDISRASTYLIKNQNARSLGFYEYDFDKKINVDLLEKSLDIIFKKLANSNIIKLDLLADAGISNIAQNIFMVGKNQGAYYDVDEAYNYRILNRLSLREWQKILDKYADFCGTVRKDLMFLADSPRNLALQGAYKLISRRATAERTIKKDILPNIKFLANTNTSYGAGYVTWFLAMDDTSKDYIWLPPSVKALEAYLVADRDYDFWSAPAGLKRGKMSRVYDVSFNPTEIDAETIYTNRWNYAVSYPLDGIIQEGQKTFQREATAFDRVNVRRLFIRIEKDLKGVGRRFMYEQFTEPTLTAFRDDINNYLTSVQARGGIVEYSLICDGRNNTTETIENNELHATIAIKPTKTIEFIVLNFVCTNQSANVEEVASRFL